MYRRSARYLPLAPITHHWFDSTQITYGVVTAGYATPKIQLEASAFKGARTGRISLEHRTAQARLTTAFGYSLNALVSERSLSTFLIEAGWEIDRHHTVFGRVENVTNDELLSDAFSPLHDQKFRVTKAEGSYAYCLPIVRPFGVALGGTLALDAKPAVLGGPCCKAPVSYTLFAQFVLGL